MPKTRLQIRLWALLLATTLAGGLTAKTTAAQASADQVVEKYLTVIGGRAALGKVTSRRATGTVTFSNQGGDVNGTIETDNKVPNKSRFAIKLDLSAMGQGEMSVEQRFDGTDGVMMNSLQGNTDITGDQLQNMRNNAFPTQLLHYKEAGMTLASLPAEKVDGKDMNVVEVTPKSGPKVKMYFDAQSGLLVRQTTHINSDQGPLDQTIDLSDYRAVGDVKVPFHVVNGTPIQTVTISYTNVEHNVPLDDSLFKKG